MTRTSWPLWQPPAETLETIASIVAEHWNEAKTSSFWPAATNWFRDAYRFTSDYHFTSGGRLIK